MIIDLNPPTLKLKKGIYNFNEENLFNIKSWKDAEELFYACLRDIKHKPSREERASNLYYVMWMQFGKVITKEYFLEVLKWVDLTIKEFEDHIEKYNLKKCVSYNWYPKLEEEYFNE